VLRGRRKKYPGPGRIRAFERSDDLSFVSTGTQILPSGTAWARQPQGQLVTLPGSGAMADAAHAKRNASRYVRQPL
jgi:hypothetical protein